MDASLKFEDLLERYRVPFQVSGRYARVGWVQFHCPYCHGGKDPHKPYCGYNTRGRYINCWRCGRHPLAKTLAVLTGEPSSVCVEWAGKLPRIAAPTRTHTGRLKVPADIGPLLPCHRDYLIGRGYDPDELIRLWGIGGIGLAPHLKWRIYIPIHYCGEVVSWTTRAIGERVTQRYISAAKDEEAVPREELLYGEDYIRHAIIVHEGPTDVWRTGPGAVATLGTTVLPAQMRAIARYPKRAICFDSQPEAQQRARALCDNLALFPGETVNIVLDAADPGVASDDEVRELRSFLE